jgi:hypothetical protein
MHSTISGALSCSIVFIMGEAYSAHRGLRVFSQLTCHTLTTGLLSYVQTVHMSDGKTIWPLMAMALLHTWPSFLSVWLCRVQPMMQAAGVYRPGTKPKILSEQRRSPCCLASAQRGGVWVILMSPRGRWCGSINAVLGLRLRAEPSESGAAERDSAHGASAIPTPRTVVHPVWRTASGISFPGGGA